MFRSAIMKTGLVLEGGGMRGLFTAGVLDVLMKNKIEFDGLVGVSAGAAFGCNFKSNQADRALRYNLRFCHDKRYCSFRSLIKTGDLFGAEFCYHTIPDELDKFDKEAFDNSPVDFFVVCTDLHTGKPIYKKLDKAGYETNEWIRASSSLPLVSKPVKLEGKMLLDGGISNSIPLEFFENEGYDKIVVVLTQPRSYTKKKSSTAKLMHLKLRKYPELIKAMDTRPDVYNQSRDYVFSREKEGKIFVLCPDNSLPAGRVEHNPEILQKTYDIGVKTTKINLKHLKDFLQD